MSRRRHVFVSHHHADDGFVDQLTGILAGNGYEIRNSSIRAKPANQRRLDEGRVSDTTIKRLLRMKMRWAKTVIVLIGERTHTRPWVNWEIEQAHKMGKRIVGVYERGGSEADIPPALKKYGDAIKRWNSDSIIAAIEGEDSSFERPDGSPSAPMHVAATSRC